MIILTPNLEKNYEIAAIFLFFLTRNKNKVIKSYVMLM